MAVDHDANETGSANGADASEPEVVDFDALNAALGALPPPGAPSSPQLADSEGRSSATYASARPHAIPATRAPVELNAPAVIVAPEEPTVPSAPPQMTVPLTPAGGIPAAPRTGPLPHGNPQNPQNPYATEQYVAVAQQHPQSDNIHVGQTVPMANAQRPRRPKTPTIVVRTRGPSRTKKLIVFIALLVIVVGGGTALLVFRPPAVLGFGAKAKPSVSPAIFPPAPPFPSSSLAPAPSSATATASSSSGTRKAAVPPVRAPHTQ